MRKALFQAMAVATLAILPATAQAVPIVGTLDLTGAVRVTANKSILSRQVPARVCASTGHEPGFRAPRRLCRPEMDLVGLPVGVQLFDTSGGAGIPGFETFPCSPLSGLNFILDIIVSCGQSSMFPATQCDAGVNSPFRFDEDTEGTTVVINFRGRVIDTNNPGEVSTFTAKFDATFTGMTPQQILNTSRPVQNGGNFYALLGPKSTIEQIQSVPEPATLLTFGAGTALLAAHRRRRAKNIIRRNRTTERKEVERLRASRPFPFQSRPPPALTSQPPTRERRPPFPPLRDRCKVSESA